MPTIPSTAFSIVPLHSPLNLQPNVTPLINHHNQVAHTINEVSEKVGNIGIPTPRKKRVKDAKTFYALTAGIEQERLKTGLQQAAHDHAKKILIQLNKPNLNPDNVYLNRFSDSVSDSRSFTGWQHNNSPDSSYSLTEVVMRNFLPGEVEFGEISGMDLYSGIYRTGINSTQGYNENNEVQLLPSEFMNKLEASDFSRDYKKSCADFWHKHSNDSRVIAKAVFITAADNARNSGHLSDAGYRLVTRAASPDLVLSNIHADDAGHALSLKDLQPRNPLKGAVRPLDVYGYPSNLLIFSDPNQAQGRGKQVLYSPVTHQLHEFDSKNALCQWLVDQAKDAKKREALLQHWTLYNQQDGNTYAGVKKALEGIGTGDTSWQPRAKPYKYLLTKDKPLKEDVFTHIAKQAQADQASNADMLVTSNAQVQEAIYLGDLKAAESILLPLAMLGPELFAIPAAIDAGAETAIGLHDITGSERASDRKQGVITTLTGLIDGVFSLGSEVPVSRDIPELKGEDFANIKHDAIGDEFKVEDAHDFELQQMSSPATPLNRNLELDLTGAVNQADTITSTANAGSVWTLPDGQNVFVKKPITYLMKGEEIGTKFQLAFVGMPDAAELRFFAQREVAATRQTALQALHENATPEAFIGTKKSAEGIEESFVATKALSNFRELGEILVDSTFVEDQLAVSKLSTQGKTALRGKIGELRQLQTQFDELKASNTEWYKLEDDSLKQSIARMRELRTEVVNELLPTRLQRQLLAHVMNDQVIGELDTVNTWGQNVGFAKSKTGKWQMVALDRGASYDVGFWGTAKDQDGFSTAKGQRPFILQSASEDSYTRQSAQYSGPLPQLGTDLSNYPYPEDVSTIAGAGQNEAIRKETLNMLAYQDMLLEGRGGADSAFNQNFEILSDPPTDRLKENGLMTKDEVIAADKSRRDARIEQAGGEDAVLQWAKGHPLEAGNIKQQANAKRSHMGLNRIA